jgi:hypothetical protein
MDRRRHGYRSGHGRLPRATGGLGLTRHGLRRNARHREHRDVPVAAGLLHDLVHRRKDERLADERSGFLGVRLVGVREDLVEL